jgi:hypothetical protein
MVLALCGAARADKLIEIPTADIAKLQAEYVKQGNASLDSITAQIGLGRGFELLGRRWQHVPGKGDSTEIGGEIQVLPEGFATPAVAIGVWDVAGNSPRGRRIFGVVTKTVPVINAIPLFPIKNVKGSLGVGSGRLSGVFLGAQASIPLGLTLAAEFDAHRTNFGIWWSPLPLIRLKAETRDGDFFYGVQLRSPL